MNFKQDKQIVKQQEIESIIEVFFFFFENEQ